MSNVNKNSIAAVISDFADNIEKHVLDPSEELSSSPASFVGTLASTLGKISAYTYYSTLMAKREVQPSTAILLKSLLRHLKSDELDSIYASPASLGFILSYPETELIKAAKPTDDGKYKLTLNKGTIFYVGDKPTFTLDYNVDIFITKYELNGELNTSIYAKYNTDDPEVGDIASFKLANSFITTRNDVIKDNVRYFTMYLDVKQYDRNYTMFDLSGENKSLSISYTDELIGFVVLYKGQSSTSYVKVPTYLEGESQTDGVNYSINDSTGTTKNIILRFSKLPDSFNPNNGTIKVVTYTTKGEDGNFKFESDDDESINNADLNVSMVQDLSDIYQDALVNIVPSGTLKECQATGGTNAKTIEDIRKTVTQDITNTVITPSEIGKAAEKKGLSSFKYRDDLHSMEYILYGFLTDSLNHVIPTKMINLSYMYDEIDLNNETGSRIIAPSDVFEWDNNEKIYKFKKSINADSYSEFYDKYKIGMTDQMNFPYFIRIQNGMSMNVTIYDESCNYTNSTKMEFLSPVILDKASIISASVYRNPMDLTIKDNLKDKNSSKYLKDYYKIQFALNTSSALVTHLKNLVDTGEDPYLKIRLVIKNKSDDGKYVTDVDLTDCTFDEENKIVYCVSYIETSSALLSTNNIAMINNSLTKLPYSSAPYSFYYIDGTVDMEFAIIFKNTSSSNVSNQYSEYLTDVEKIDNYYVGIVYSISDVSISKNVSDTVNIIPDVKLTQPVYKVANEDIADTYESDVYKLSSDGASYELADIVKTLPDGSTSTTKSYVTLHKAGDIKKEYDGRVGSYNVLGNSWTWSDDSADVPGVYNDGSVLGQVPIYCMVQWNGLVIFGGADGRVGCYDSKESNFGRWHNYNTTEKFRTSSEYRQQYIIKNDGSAMGGNAIRGMIVVSRTINNEKKDALIVYGDGGRVASCDLSTNTWRKYNGDGENSVAIYFNNGSCTGNENIYAAEKYTVPSNGNEIVVFGGGSGRVCSLDIKNVKWYDYNTTSIFSSIEHPFNDGSVRNYKAILTIAKHLDSILYFSGIDSVVSTLDIPTGTFSHMNDGSVMGNVPTYASTIISGIYVIAGKGGRVASYSISKNTWSLYSQGSGLTDDGSHIGNVDIFGVIGFDVNVIFAGGDGRVCSFDVSTNEWTEYSASTGLRNEGSFIKNTISAVTFDSSESNIIYFAGKAGNIVYKYKKGDILLDENGKPLIDIPIKQKGYLKGIPAYSRIFGIESKYTDVVNSYNGLLNKINSLYTDFPDGCSMFCGVKTTSGKSSTFKFKNISTNEEENLDSLAISINIGVKFDDSITSTNRSFLVSSIGTKIEEYIIDIQNTTETMIELNVDEMLNAIKDEIPNIKYFEFYGINNYSSKELQTIYCDKSTNNGLLPEYLSIKNKINEEKSDISNRQIELVPAINITIL